MLKTRRQGRVYRCSSFAGLLSETNTGYQFEYDHVYLASNLAAISLTLPKREKAFSSEYVFPFFVSLLAEGNLAFEQCQRLKIDEQDLFGRLIQTAGGDVIGSVTVEEFSDG